MFYSDFAEDYEQIFPLQEKVFSFLKNYAASGNSAVLDIGCATGHYCGRFIEDGYRVTGIDLDTGMIQAARQKYPDPVFKVMNLMDLAHVGGIFELVYSIGNVMAHVSESSFSHFLQLLKEKMHNDSVWIFQVINWDYILGKQNFTFPVIETADKLFLRTYTDITNSSLSFNTRLKRKISGEIIFEDSVTLYPVPSERYISFHREAGFKLTGHYADFGKATFDKDTFSAGIYVFKKN